MNDDLSADKQFKVTMFLADAATVSPAEGKVNALGIGWTVTGPGPSTFAIAGVVEVPWQLTNRQHILRFELIDVDGDTIEVPTPEGEQPLVAEGSFEVGRPAGVRIGADIGMPFALPFTGVQFPPGGHFEWRLSINGETREEWRLAFSTRPPGLQAVA